MFYKHFVIPAYNFMETLTEAQQQLYDWLADSPPSTLSFNSTDDAQ